ncbi:MAG: metallophosphoesterase [Bacteroidetes bacterium]|nr:metallophosphoesterase [Bacteroidota bacterium]
MKYLVQVCLFFACLFAMHSAFAQAMNKPGRKQQGFDVVVFGDMPYSIPADYPRFENLLNYVNKQNQAFNVFVGDIKSSSVACKDEVYQKVYDYFNRSEKPLIYTPGDNEWTDCQKPAQKFDRNERLAFLRSLFFKDSRSLGKERMKLQSQSANLLYATYVENMRWSYQNVLFATIHLVGSNNNLLPADPNGNAEFKERCKADSFWLDETFREAQKANSNGIVLFTHADMFTPEEASDGFNAILAQLWSLSKACGKPVLLVNGDSHKFLVDKPFFADKEKKSTLLNFTRLQVFGEVDMDAVVIHADPADPSLFTIRQLIVPGNQ